MFFSAQLSSKFETVEKEILSTGKQKKCHCSENCNYYLDRLFSENCSEKRKQIPLLLSCICYCVSTASCSALNYSTHVIYLPLTYQYCHVTVYGCLILSTHTLLKYHYHLIVCGSSYPFLYCDINLFICIHIYTYLGLCVYQV